MIPKHFHNFFAYQMRPKQASLRPFSQSYRISIVVLGSLLVISVITNAVMIWLFSHFVAESVSISRYVDLFPAEKQLVTYHSYTSFSDPDEMAANQAWANLNPDEGWILLPHEWAAERGLPLAGMRPWETHQGVYILDAYHQLHCLMAIRNYTLALIHEEESEYQTHHISHCFDNIRQAIMCRADDTPWYALGLGPTGDGQVRKCRNWDQFSRWAINHTACYRKDLGIPLMDRFRNCT